MVRAFCQRLREEWAGERAVPIPSMPKAVVRESLGSLKVGFEQVPVGLRYRDLEQVCLNMGRLGVGQVLSMDRRDLYPVAEGMAELVKKETDWELYVFDPAKAVDVDGLDEDHYLTDKPEEAVVKLFWTTVERHNAWKRAGGRERGRQSSIPL